MPLQPAYETQMRQLLETTAAKLLAFDSAYMPERQEVEAGLALTAAQVRGYVTRRLYRSDPSRSTGPAPGNHGRSISQCGGGHATTKRRPFS